MDRTATRTFQALIRLTAYGVLTLGIRYMQSLRGFMRDAKHEPTREPTRKAAEAAPKIKTREPDMNPRTAKIATSKQKSGEGKRVLIADDAVDNRLLIQMMLRRTGAEVETANDGAEAIEMAMRNQPDAVIMDVQMPKVDGFSATARLRHLGFRKPIISCTARHLGDEEQLARRSGCDAHLEKPLERAKLLETLESLWNRDAQP